MNEPEPEIYCGVPGAPGGGGGGGAAIPASAITLFIAACACVFCSGVSISAHLSKSASAFVEPTQLTICGDHLSVSHTSVVDAFSFGNTFAIMSSAIFRWSGCIASRSAFDAASISSIADATAVAQSGSAPGGGDDVAVPGPGVAAEPVAGVVGGGE